MVNIGTSLRPHRKTRYHAMMPHAIDILKEQLHLSTI